MIINFENNEIWLSFRSLMLKRRIRTLSVSWSIMVGIVFLISDSKLRVLAYLLYTCSLSLKFTVDEDWVAREMTWHYQHTIKYANILLSIRIWWLCLFIIMTLIFVCWMMFNLVCSSILLIRWLGITDMDTQYFLGSLMWCIFFELIGILFHCIEPLCCSNLACWYTQPNKKDWVLLVYIPLQLDFCYTCGAVARIKPL